MRLPNGVCAPPRPEFVSGGRPRGTRLLDPELEKWARSIEEKWAAAEAAAEIVREREREAQLVRVRLIREVSPAAVAAVVAVGLELLAAKRGLKDRRWLTLLKSVSFGTRKAQRHIKIAEHRVLSDASHWDALPPSWRTLSELATLSAEKVEAAIRARAVRPEMKRHEAEALLGRTYTGYRNIKVRQEKYEAVERAAVRDPHGAYACHTKREAFSAVVDYLFDLYPRIVAGTAFVVEVEREPWADDGAPLFYESAPEREAA